MNVLKNNDRIAQIIINAANNSDFEPRFNCSGRGMFGKNCFGIVGKSNNIGKFYFELFELIQINDDFDLSDFDCVKKFSEDSMGYDSIFYFPNLQIENDDEEETEDQEEIDE